MTPLDRQQEIADVLSGFKLFSDLTTPELMSVVETFDEVSIPEGERVLRQGLTGSGFYVILEGEAAVRVDGADRGTLPRGDFFGEISILLGELPAADVIALTPMRCLVLPGDQVEGFLTSNPQVMYRMLQVQARRLRKSNQWRS
jgi:CRP-like cAMP-binding protein